MMKIVYVILHYNTYEVTCECIDSILKMKSNESEIVVVDNNSVNRSYDALVDKYMGNNQVHLIQTSCNLGFANGNNFGYAYAKNNLNAQIIVDINNDVTIEQPDFEDIIQSSCNDDIGVLAPRIINIRGYEQNPFREQPIPTSKMIKRFIVYGIYTLLLFIPLVNSGVMFLYNRKAENKTIRNTEPDKCARYGIVPHGSCVVFMPSYVEKTNMGFHPGTFFYGEEDLLYDLVRFYGLKTYYCPEAFINHKEKVATSTINQDEVKRARFVAWNKCRSALVCAMYRLKPHTL